MKSRNAVSSATNNWRYDNSADDYFTKDTLVLNSARSYRLDYCKGVNWSFYKDRNFIIEFVQYCQEPPVKKVSTSSDYIKLKIKKLKGKIYLRLFNKSGQFDFFQVLNIRRNTPIGDYEVQFDYTLVLLRVK